VGFEVVVVQAVGEKMQVVNHVEEIQMGEGDHIPLARYNALCYSKGKEADDNALADTATSSIKPTGIDIEDRMEHWGESFPCPFRR
jgi:hypothetical protein